MFFERIGRLVRPWWYLFALALPLAAGLILAHRSSSREQLEEQFFVTKKRASPAFARKERSEKFWARHAHSDPYFLDQELESLRFLGKEQTLLQTWVSHPAMSSRKEFEQRLSFLQSERNRLLFTEEKTLTSPACKETREIQRHPIQLDETDLKALLALIEEIPSSSKNQRPQLIITDFHLARKNQVFELQMHLLKRDFP